MAGLICLLVVVGWILLFNLQLGPCVKLVKAINKEIKNKNEFTKIQLKVHIYKKIMPVI